ncbi:MAG: methionyl-tRNA formyltransferase [Chlamydiota bacterium]
MNIVFFGTSSFAARILARLIEKKYCISAIVTRADKPRGRQLQVCPPPVKEIALQICPEVPLFQPEKASAPEFAEVIKAFEPDLFIVVAYGEIIKQNLLSMPKLGCVNIHASLLPKYRGAAPIQRAIMAGEPQTGITIIEMAPQMDAGDIIAIEALEIPLEMTFGELEPKLCELGAKLILQVISEFERDSVVRTPQEHSLATLAAKLQPEEEKIDWSLPSEVIHNKIRAFSPTPGAWCSIQMGDEVKRIKIKKSLSVAHATNTTHPPGSIVEMGKGGWIVACGSGFLRLIEVQLEGKKTLPADDFIKGVRQPISFKI